MEIGFFTLPEKIWNENKGKFEDNKLYSWDELEEFRKKNNFDYIEFMIEHMYYHNTLNQNPARYAIYLYLTRLYCIKRILNLCATFTKCRF